MIDWTKQTEEALQSWADAQKQLWSGWVDAAGQQVNQTQLTDTWRKAVDTWEEAVKNGLKAQDEWSRTLSENMAAVPNVPKDIQVWANQTQEVGAHWNTAQKDLWESYFGMVRKAVPVKALGTVEAENQKLFDTLQAAVEKITAAQSEWGQMWTEQAAKAAPKATASNAKKSAVA